MRWAVGGCAAAGLFGVLVGACNYKPASGPCHRGRTGCPCETADDCLNGLYCTDEECTEEEPPDDDDAGDGDGGCQGVGQPCEHEGDCCGATCYLNTCYEEDCDHDLGPSPEPMLCPDGTFLCGWDEFACCDYGGECHLPDDCDIWAPDSCPDGAKCTAWANMGTSWNANKCVDIMGSALAGENCMATDGSGVSGNDTCYAGSICWDIDPDTLTGYCVDFCEGSPQDPQCPDCTACQIYNEGVLPLCLSMCDPLKGGSDCPDPKDHCELTADGADFVCVVGSGDGPGTHGAECEDPNACNPGLFCADAEDYPGCNGTGCCSEFCDVDQPNLCNGAGQVCVAWYPQNQAPCGLEHVGGCRLP